VGDISAMVSHTDRNTVAGKRDAALLLFGMTSAMRRSELVAMNVEDLELVAGEGLRVDLPQSKTNQEGDEEFKAIALQKRANLCAVRSLLEWLHAAGITSGPVFRSVDRNGHARRPALSAQMVARIVKKYAAKAGLKASEFAGHSLRSGVATSSSERGAPLQAVANLGGWRRLETAAGYVQKQDVWKDHAAKGLL